MDFKPLGNKLLIKIKKTETQTEGGIIIPTEKLTKDAEVIEVGPDVLDIQKGDNIMLDKLEGAEIKLDGEQYYVIIEENVIGIY